MHALSRTSLQEKDRGSRASNFSLKDRWRLSNLDRVKKIGDGTNKIVEESSPKTNIPVDLIRPVWGELLASNFRISKAYDT
jgi:hypothetical protein